MALSKKLISVLVLFIIALALCEAHEHDQTKLGIYSLIKIDSSTRVTYSSIIKLRHDNTKYW